MKIIEFIPELSMGGAETLVKDYCFKIDKTKFEIVVLCSIKFGTPWEKALETAGIRVVYINDYSNRKPKSVLEKYIIQKKRFRFVKRFFKDENPNVIHIHLGLAEYVYRSRVLCSVYYTVHNTPDFVWGSNRHEEKFCRKLVTHNGMRFITLHDEMRREVNERFHVNNSIVLNNGIDFSKFDIPVDKAGVRKSLGIPENAFVIGHVGRFVDQKNHAFLAEIFAKVYEKNKAAFLLMVGNGSLKDKVCCELNSCGLEEKYLVLSDRSDIPELLKIMDIFVFPSLFEGLPIVLVEAQKSGLPCVVSDAIPQAVKLTNLVQFKSLSDSAESWGNVALNFKVKEIESYGLEDYDMNNVIHRLESIYSGVKL